MTSNCRTGFGIRITPSSTTATWKRAGGRSRFLNNERLLPLVIRSVPVTNVYGEKPPTPNCGGRNRESDRQRGQEELRDARLLGRRRQDHGRAIRSKPLVRRLAAFYEVLVDDLVEAAEAFKALDASCDAHFGRDAPGIGNIRKAIRRRSPVGRPHFGPQAGGGAGTPRTSLTRRRKNPSPKSPNRAARVGRERRRARLPARRPATASRRASGSIADADEARMRISDAAAYLRRERAGVAAVSYLVTRALRMGELYSPGLSPSSSSLPSPSSETRQLLKRLAAEGWASGKNFSIAASDR